MTDRFRPPLPPYKAVLVVDAERYSRTSSLEQRTLSGMIPEVLEKAFRRSGMAEQWERAAFPQSTGDGYVVGIDPEHLPRLVHPLLAEIQAELEEVQGGLAARNRALRLRLRAGIEVGPLHDSGGADALDGVGRAMTEAHRLVDSPPVREALSSSVPDITLLSAIVSRRVYEDAIEAGYVGLDPRHFRSVDALIPAKEFQAEGYVYVPRLVPQAASGAVPATADEGAAEVGPADGESGGGQTGGADTPGGPSGGAVGSGIRGTGRPSGGVSADRGAAANQAGTVSGGAVQAGNVYGGLHTGDRNDSTTRYGGVGDISGEVGTVITGASGPVHTGHGDQHNSPPPPPSGAQRRSRRRVRDKDGWDVWDGHEDGGEESW